jgi:serine/threonine protein kinase
MPSTTRRNAFRPLTEPAYLPRCGSMPLPPGVLKPPTHPGDLGRLGTYRVRRVLGSGGMGVVYLAVDPKLNREIALKVMHARCAVDPVTRARFSREARAQAAIDHEHVVPIFHVGEIAGVPYFTMPRLKGRTLAAALPPCPVPTVELLRIGREIAEGLTVAHAAGLVHRDIKPANIWLEWACGRVKILDFGLAKSSTGDDAAPLTVCGTVVGTPSYMSPEQARGWHVDFRSDLFSLGSLLYLMATGRQPFRGSTAMEVLLAVAGRTPVPPVARNPFLPHPISLLIMRLLAKRRRERPVSASEVVEELSRIEREWSVP